MRAELGLPSVRGDDEKGGGMMGGFGGSMGGVGQGAKGKRPISVKFEIPYFTTSGIQVRYLKIIEPKVSLSFPVVGVAAAGKRRRIAEDVPAGLGSRPGRDRLEPWNGPRVGVSVGDPLRTPRSRPPFRSVS